MPTNVANLKVITCLLLFLAAPCAWAADLTVFAASSLKTALDDITAAFEDETGGRVSISYAGTSTLARQIQRGAPADIVIAANVEWMDALEKGGHIVRETRRNLLGNRLVVVSQKDATPISHNNPEPDLGDMLGDNWLAMAMVDAVPAGIYGKEALTNLGLWEQIEPRVAQADNVRAALAYVAVGEAAFGIVYATDAKAEPRVSVVAEIDPSLHQPIVYPAAIVQGGDPVALKLLEFLTGPFARQVFKEQGFSVIGDTP